jgi:hypothetical protein
MYDISVFIKELKGRFAQWFNQRHDRYGVLWTERFNPKSEFSLRQIKLVLFQAVMRE